MNIRPYPHKPNEERLLESATNLREDFASGLLKSAKAEAERRSEFFRIHCGITVDLAALEYAFQGSPAAVLGRWTAAGEAARLAQEFGQLLDPLLYMSYLALSILSSTEAFRNRLEGLSRTHFTDPSVKATEIHYRAAEAMRDLSRGQLGEAGQASGRGLTLLNEPPLHLATRDAMDALIQIEDAIARKDQTKLIEAVRARSERNKRAHSKGPTKNFPAALLDVHGLALLKLAREQGLDPSTGSVYLPTEYLPS